MEELIEINLYQLADEPTNSWGERMSCIDLIITGQPNLFIELGVHPSLDSHCQHQLIYGKLNISSSTPPGYFIAETSKIRDISNSFDGNLLILIFDLKR